MIEKLNLTEDQKEKHKGYYLSEESQLKIANQLLERFKFKNKELEKYRDCSSLKYGWQTSILAKKQRKLEELSKEITIIRTVLFDDWNIEI